MSDLLALLPVPLTDQIDEVTRELDMRRALYPRWVAEKRMPQKRAERQIANLEAVLGTLKCLLKSPLIE